MGISKDVKMEWRRVKAREEKGRGGEEERKKKKRERKKAGRL